MEPRGPGQTVRYMNRNTAREAAEASRGGCPRSLAQRVCISERERERSQGGRAERQNSQKTKPEAGRQGPGQRVSAANEGIARNIRRRRRRHVGDCSSDRSRRRANQGRRRAGEHVWGGVDWWGALWREGEQQPGVSGGGGGGGGVVVVVLVASGGLRPGQSSVSSGLTPAQARLAGWMELISLVPGTEAHTYREHGGVAPSPMRRWAGLPACSSTHGQQRNLSKGRCSSRMSVGLQASHYGRGDEMYYVFSTCCSRVSVPKWIQPTGSLAGQHVAQRLGCHCDE